MLSEWECLLDDFFRYTKARKVFSEGLMWGSPFIGTGEIMADKFQSHTKERGSSNLGGCVTRKEQNRNTELSKTVSVIQRQRPQGLERWLTHCPDGSRTAPAEGQSSTPQPSSSSSERHLKFFFFIFTLFQSSFITKQGDTLICLPLVSYQRDSETVWALGPLVNVWEDQRGSEICTDWFLTQSFNMSPVCWPYHSKGWGRWV